MIQKIMRPRRSLHPRHKCFPQYIGFARLTGQREQIIYCTYPDSSEWIFNSNTSLRGYWSKWFPIYRHHPCNKVGKVLQHSDNPIRNPVCREGLQWKECNTNHAHYGLDLEC